MRFRHVLPLLFYINFTCISLYSVGQLKPGKEMPPIQVKSYVGMQARQIDLNKKSTYIILDFWNTWCNSCIKGLRKLDSLQFKFGKELTILAVTTQKEKSVRAFLERKGIVLPNLPMHFADSLLSGYFPYQSLPHTAWIKNGKLDFVTYGYNVNERNITKWLNGEPLRMAYKDAEKIFNPEAALWDKRNQVFDQDIRQYSFLSGWQYDYGSSLFRGFIDSSRGVAGKRFINIQLKNLLIEAFGNCFRYSNRVIKEDESVNWIVWDGNYSDDELLRQRNLVCYEISVSMERFKNVGEYIREDVGRYFDFDAVVEKRLVPCEVIRNSEIYDSTKSNRYDFYFMKTEDSILYSGSVHSLITVLQQEMRNLNTAVIDSSVGERFIAFALKGKLADKGTISKILKLGGLVMKKENCKIDMLILRKRKDLAG